MSKLADGCIPASVVFPPHQRWYASVVWMDASTATVFSAAYRIGLFSEAGI
jgi:hypothetical protein